MMSSEFNFNLKGIPLLLLLMLSYSNIQAQSNVLKGKILDKKTKEPLPFATVSIKGTDHGTVSNFLGEFTLDISKQEQGSMLFVSMLGYAPLSVQNGSLTSSKIVFELEEQAILLETLQIDEEEESAVEMIATAIERIPENYPSSPYRHYGFARAHKAECGEYKHLYEAAFSVFGPGYNTKPKVGSPEKIFVEESRQTPAVQEYMATTMSAHRNPFIAYYHLNDVLKVRQSMATGQNEYKVDRYIVLDEKLVAVIKGRFNKVDEKYRSYTIYVDTETYSILQVEMDMPTPEGEVWNPWLLKGKASDSSFMRVKHLKKKLQFEQFRGKYLPKYINWSIIGDVAYNDTEESFCDWEARFEMMFFDVDFDNPTRPDKKRLMKAKERKDPDLMPYNQEFWDTSPLPLAFPIDENIVRDLGSLETRQIHWIK